MKWYSQCVRMKRTRLDLTQIAGSQIVHWSLQSWQENPVYTTQVLTITLPHCRRGRKIEFKPHNPVLTITETDCLPDMHWVENKYFIWHTALWDLNMNGSSPKIEHVCWAFKSRLYWQILRNTFADTRTSNMKLHKLSHCWRLEFSFCAMDSWHFYQRTISQKSSRRHTEKWWTFIKATTV